MKNDLDIKDLGDKYRRARTEFDTQKVCTERTRETKREYTMKGLRAVKTSVRVMHRTRDRLVISRYQMYSHKKWLITYNYIAGSVSLFLP